MQVHKISSSETHDLRRRVLRGGRADAVVVYDGDDDAGTVHFGASPVAQSGDTPSAHRSGGGGPASEGRATQRGAVGSLYRVAMKDQAQALGVVPERQFQFRGMASAPEVRGMGCADAVMRAMIDHVRGETPAGVASLLWCNARVSAVGFYQRFGMRVAGAEFDIPGIGPHVVMTVLVEPIGAKA